MWASAAATCPTERPSTTMPVSPSMTASGAPPERPAITGRPQSAASANTMPKPSTSIPPQRERQGEAKRSAAWSHSCTGRVDQRAGEVHALAHAALLGAVVQARLHATLADERQVQARELGREPRERLDEHVLTLARHEAAEAHDEVAVDAEALLERRGVVRPTPARTPPP